MNTHKLKSDSIPFRHVAKEIKTYELRKDDRDFKVDDALHLCQTEYTGEEMERGHPLIFTGLEIYCQISHIVRGDQWGLKKGWVILSIRNVFTN